MAAWGDGELELVLIDGTGRAGIYSRQGDTIKLSGWLPGSAFRVAVSPDPVALRSLSRRRVESAARALTADIREQYSKDHLEEADRDLCELERIGYVHVGLALKAEEARRRGDMAGELGAYARLLSLLPADHAGLMDSLARYAQLLERIWQIKEAHAVYQRLHKLSGPGAQSTETLLRLGRYIQAMESHEYIIECAEPLSTLVPCATALDRPLTGRYVLGTVGPGVRCYGAVSSTDALDRYEQVRAAVYKAALPAAEETRFVWFSGSGMEHVEAVVVTLDGSRPSAHLEYCLKISRTGGHTVFAPILVVQADDQAPGMTAVGHNEQISSFLRSVPESESCRALAHAVRECFQDAIARLLTKQLAAKTYEGRNAHG
jgi:tetratricopeptide (TPR) repeat protein